LDIFIAIWHILWPIGMLCCHMGCFSTFWYVATLKIWQPRWKLFLLIKWPLSRVSEEDVTYIRKCNPL
jgi:hypothetical protein